MYRMTSGSILIMCLLIFAFSGADRLPLVRGPSGAALSGEPGSAPAAEIFYPETALSENIEKAAAPDAGTERPPQPAVVPVAVASVLPGAAVRPAYEPARAEAAAGIGDLYREIACAAGFPLAFPAETAVYAPLEWNVVYGESATVRFHNVHGGYIEYTQKLGAAASGTEPAEETQSYVPGPRPETEIVWTDGDVVRFVRSAGLTDMEIRTWIRGLAPAADCSP